MVVGTFTAFCTYRGMPDFADSEIWCMNAWQTKISRSPFQSSGQRALFACPSVSPVAHIDRPSGISECLHHTVRDISTTKRMCFFYNSHG
jgi:hypothetical protein